MEFVSDSEAKIEKVSAYEIYQLDTSGTRIKRICGFGQLGSECLNPAGKGTTHKGMGFCDRHDKKSGSKLWKIFAKEKNLPATLGEYLKQTKELEQNDLMEVDSDIKILYALMMNIMHREEGKEDIELSRNDINVIRLIIKDIADLKRTRHTMSKEAKLDMSSVAEFVTQFFKVLETYVQGHVYQNVVQAVMKDVIIPMSTQRKIVDADTAKFRELVDPTKYLGPTKKDTA